MTEIVYTLRFLLNSEGVLNKAHALSESSICFLKDYLIVLCAHSNYRYPKQIRDKCVIKAWYISNTVCLHCLIISLKNRPIIGTDNTISIYMYTF